jgi:hypothetical protein
MKHTLFVCLLGILQTSAFGVEITVGQTRLSIPAPAGFSAITGEMKPYAELAQRFVPPSNEQFALFLPDADVALAAKGQVPNSERKFYVQTTKTLVQPFVGSTDFSQLKGMIKTQNENTLKKIEEQVPDFLQKVNQGMAKDYGVDLGLSLTQMVPLPPHHETDRSLAYSMMVRMNAKDATGAPAVFEGVVTATFVHLQGKVLFLYVNAEKSALEWSRDQAQAWADAIIAANPSVGSVADRENRERLGGINWNEVGSTAIIGGIIGGVIGLVMYVFRRKGG